jgi:type I restriction enzyme, S subunit
MKLCPTSQFPFVCLGACGEIVTGSTPSKANSKFWDGGIPFVTPAQLGFQPPITTADEYVTTDGAERGRLLPEGAVLVCCIGSLGKTGVAGVPLISNQQINSIIFDPNQVDARYGYYAARSLTPLLEHFAPSTTIKIVKKSTFAKLQIPLPPLAEQKRIAGILDAADVLRAKRRESLAQLDTLLQSTFLDMFGDPVTNPMGWDEKAVRDTDSLVQIGPFGSLLHKEDYVSGGVPLINPKHIVDGVVVVGCDETVPQDKIEELNNYRLQVNDVIMGRRGKMGRCAVVTEQTASMLCGTGSLFIRPNPDVLTALYLSKVISSESMKAQLERIAWGVTMANLNRSKIESLSIPVPPLDLQHRFVTIVKSVEKQKARQRAHLAELDTLFASLQQRAFNGEL